MSGVAGPSSSSAAATVSATTLKPPPPVVIEKKKPTTSMLGIKRKENDEIEKKTKSAKIDESLSIPSAKKALLALDYGSSSDDD